MGEVLEVFSDSLHIDTLIMQDDSRIVFLAPETKLVIENAFVGKNCKWDASGASAINKPKFNALSVFADGSTATYIPKTQRVQMVNASNNGRNIYASVIFRFLYGLTIDTSGEYGHVGRTGMTGAKGLDGSNAAPNGQPGGDGGPGGSGGDGGTLSLLYACDGFSPVFLKEGFRSINLLYRGGLGGSGGPPGRGGNGGVARRYIDNGNNTVEWDGRKGSTGPYGRFGPSGDNGMDGALILKKLN